MQNPPYVAHKTPSVFTLSNTANGGPSEDTLLGSDTTAGGKFGFKVDIHEALAVVTRTTDGGSFYGFTRNVDNLDGWTEQQISIPTLETALQ